MVFNSITDDAMSISGLSIACDDIQPRITLLLRLKLNLRCIKLTHAVNYTFSNNVREHVYRV